MSTTPDSTPEDEPPAPIPSPDLSTIGSGSFIAVGCVVVTFVIILIGIVIAQFV